MDFPSILPNKYKRLLCEDILIPPDRQRQEIDTTDIDQSILERGVLMPIIVRPTTLGDKSDKIWAIVAGERRLRSSIKLGIPDIPVRLGGELSKDEWELIELEENIKRKNLLWQEEARAIYRIHELKSSQSPDWTADATAKFVGMDPGNVTRVLRVVPELGSARIAGAEGLRPAWNILSRLDERRGADIINSLVESGIGAFMPGFDTPEPSTEIPFDLPLAPDGASPPRPISLAPLPKPGNGLLLPPKLSDSILNVDFLEWAPSYTGQRFNFIHMDPPYGVNVFAGNMSGRQGHDTYSDEETVYWDILKCFCENIDRLMTGGSHFMLWFSMDYYSETLAFFAQNAPSLNFSNFPLIWVKSDNVGILPDPKRGPRRIYETALVASREDHLIGRPVSNAYSAPTDKTFHTSTKPEPMLRHFFQMFVDETTRLFDPTCGSGSALRAAESLGASQVLGLERDPKHFEAAQTALKSFRNLKRAGK